MNELQCPSDDHTPNQQADLRDTLTQEINTHKIKAENIRAKGTGRQRHSQEKWSFNLMSRLSSPNLLLVNDDAKLVSPSLAVSKFNLLRPP